MGVGAIYTQQEQWEKALTSYEYEKVLPLLEQIDNAVGLASSFAVLGVIYQELGQLEDAIKHHREALNVYWSLESGFEAEIADELEQLAECYAQTGADEKSSSYKEQAQQIRENLQEI